MRRKQTERTVRVTLRPKGLAYLPLRHIRAQLPGRPCLAMAEHVTLAELCELAARSGLVPVVELRCADEAARIFEMDGEVM